MKPIQALSIVLVIDILGALAGIALNSMSLTILAAFGCGVCAGLITAYAEGKKS